MNLNLNLNWHVRYVSEKLKLTMYGRSATLNRFHHEVPCHSGTYPRLCRKCRLDFVLRWLCKFIESIDQWPKCSKVNKTEVINSAPMPQRLRPVPWPNNIATASATPTTTATWLPTKYTAPSIGGRWSSTRALHVYSMATRTLDIDRMICSTGLARSRLAGLLMRLLSMLSLWATGILRFTR